MKPIAILSNKTRAEQRPPLKVSQVDAELLARFGFKKTRPAPKPAASFKRSARNKRENRPASTTPSAPGPSKAAQKPPAASTPPAVSPPPAAPSRPASSPPSAVPSQRTPTWQKPAAQQRPVYQRPHNQPPLPGGQPPVEKTPGAAATPKASPPFQPTNPKPAAQQPPEPRKPQGLAQPDPKEQTPPRKQFLVKPPQAPNNVPGRPNAPNNRAPLQPPSQRTPDRKDPPAAQTPPPGRDPSRPQPPANQNPPAKRVENNPPQSTPTGANGTPPAKNGANGNGARVNGKDFGSLRDLRAPGENGNKNNGSISHTSLFRPGAFASIPTLRIPPKAGDPVQHPPTQIPMEVYSRPEGERSTPAKNEVPPASPVPPKPQQPRTPSLDQLFKQNTRLPAKAAILGVCEDGLPVLIDLADPAPGALVVIGDEREAQLDILRAAVTSVVGRNSPRSVQFLVFSCEPDAWESWARAKGIDRHILAIEDAEAETVRDWIVRLADWTEQRRMGQSSGPAVLLVMDTLSFLPALEYDIRLNFEWMAKEGPPAQIWPLAVISTDLAKALSGRRMLRAFQTRVMGYANNPEDYVPLAGLEPQAAQAFLRQGEFKVKTGEIWLRFRLPGL